MPVRAGRGMVKDHVAVYDDRPILFLDRSLTTSVKHLVGDLDIRVLHEILLTENSTRRQDGQQAGLVPARASC